MSNNLGSLADVLYQEYSYIQFFVKLAVNPVAVLPSFNRETPKKEQTTDLVDDCSSFLYN